jgi:hypothetical protein
MKKFMSFRAKGNCLDGKIDFFHSAKQVREDFIVNLLSNNARLKTNLFLKASCFTNHCEVSAPKSVANELTDEVENDGQCGVGNVERKPLVSSELC